MLALGLIGWFVCPVAIAAVVMAGGDLKLMKRHAMDPSGQGMTKAGYWLGMATLLCWIGFVLIFAILFMAGAAFSGLRG
jgi:hypothetical protein